ncbi:hypothetical protein Tco_1015849 [Tanacetum coccineum]|uniref:Uncharacterized protein n=1 Tax=Tanacetum coccineum TaxID=301880 RepID=A0ABQ5FN17_9ASTR
MPECFLPFLNLLTQLTFVSTFFPPPSSKAAYLLPDMRGLHMMEDGNNNMVRAPIEGVRREKWGPLVAESGESGGVMVEEEDEEDIEFVS